jgi:hypothetical protein
LRGLCGGQTRSKNQTTGQINHSNKQLKKKHNVNRHAVRARQRRLQRQFLLPHPRPTQGRQKPRAKKCAARVRPPRHKPRQPPLSSTQEQHGTRDRSASFFPGSSRWTSRRDYRSRRGGLGELSESWLSGGGWSEGGGPRALKLDSEISAFFNYHRFFHNHIQIDFANLLADEAAWRRLCRCAQLQNKPANKKNPKAKQNLAKNIKGSAENKSKKSCKSLGRNRANTEPRDFRKTALFKQPPGRRTAYTCDIYRDAVKKPPAVKKIQRPSGASQLPSSGLRAPRHTTRRPFEYPPVML